MSEALSVGYFILSLAPLAPADLFTYHPPRNPPFCALMLVCGTTIFLPLTTRPEEWPDRAQLRRERPQANPEGPQLR